MNLCIYNYMVNLVRILLLVCSMCTMFAKKGDIVYSISVCAGTVSSRELSEMKARLLLNLGCVYDGMKEPQRCSDFIRQSIYIAE